MTSPNAIAAADSSAIMNKMHNYNNLFDGTSKIMDASTQPLIEDLWDSTNLQIHRSEGIIQGYQDFFETVSRYLEQGLRTDFLVLEAHPKGLRYVVKAVLPGKEAMVLESIATVQNEKIIKIEPGANSDIQKFLGK
jgi:hypothetical protein